MKTEQKCRHLKFTVNHEDAGLRIDVFLAGKYQVISRAVIQKLIKQGSVKYNTEPCLEQKMRVAEGSEVEFDIPDDPEILYPKPENIPIEQLYEDDDILIINKSPDIVIHPGDGCSEGTLVNALLSRYDGFADNFINHIRPGIVHRLDKETSGCLIIARNQEALHTLSIAFRKHEPEKTYLAVVAGHFNEKSGTVNRKIGRHPVSRKKMSVLENAGKDAVTHYKVVKEGLFQELPVSLLEVKIETGRTHQIRVHMSYLHHPVLGDKVYGGAKRFDLPRQMLHAWKLKINHPSTGEKMEFTAQVPDDMRNIIDVM